MSAHRDPDDGLIWVVGHLHEPRFVASLPDGAFLRDQGHLSLDGLVGSGAGGGSGSVECSRLYREAVEVIQLFREHYHAACAEGWRVCFFIAGGGTPTEGIECIPETVGSIDKVLDLAGGGGDAPNSGRRPGFRVLSRLPLSGAGASGERPARMDARACDDVDRPLWSGDGPSRNDFVDKISMAIEYLNELEEDLRTGAVRYACQSTKQNEWHIEARIEEIRLKARKSADFRQMDTHIYRLIDKDEATSEDSYLVVRRILEPGPRGNPRIEWSLIESREAAETLRDVSMGPSPYFGATVEETLQPTG